MFKSKILFLVIMISLFSSKLNASYEKLAFDFSFKDLDGSEMKLGKSAVPKWNFHKIIIGKDGKIFDTFSSITKPTSGKFVKVIEEALNK